jgi:hypothetical protein
MAKGQRASKRSPEVEKRILDAIRLGATYKLASQYACIDPATFWRWVEKDANFATRVKEAEGAATVGWLAKIEKAASDGNWQAAAWKLERRYPEDYSLRQRLEHTGADGGPIEIDERLILSEAELDQYVLTIVERAGARLDQPRTEPQPRLAPPEGTTNGRVSQ